MGNQKKIEIIAGTLYFKVIHYLHLPHTLFVCHGMVGTTLTMSF